MPVYWARGRVRVRSLSQEAGQHPGLKEEQLPSSLSAFHRVVYRPLAAADLLSPLPAVRHADGLYDSYMRTDHVVNDDMDAEGRCPSGLPPLPKHTVSERR